MVGRWAFAALFIVTPVYESSWCHCREDVLDTNAFMLEPKAKRPAADAGPDPAAAPAKKLSKSQKRKLRKVQEDKAKRAERTQVRHCISVSSSMQGSQAKSLSRETLKVDAFGALGRGGGD